MQKLLDGFTSLEYLSTAKSLRQHGGAALRPEGCRGLRTLAAQLRRDHPGAASSIEEGLDETFTLIALGVVGALHRTLATTNPIENLQGTIRRISRNVKRWRGGAMALRWTVSALMGAERKFRRVKGHRDILKLIAALDATVGIDTVNRNIRIA